MGFLEVPQLFPGWSTDWEPMPPDPDFELPLRQGPSPGREVVVHVTSGDMLDAVEFDYEVRGARVFGRSEGWSLLRTLDGATGWAEPIDGARFHPLEDRLLDGLTYLTPAFDGFLARTPGGEERVAIPPDPRRVVLGTLEARTSRTLVILEPGEDPDGVRQRFRGGSYRLSSPRPDGTRVLNLQIGNVHPLFGSPSVSVDAVGEVETIRPGWSLYVGGGGGTPEGVLVFDTLPGWFQVALRHFEWREAPRVWLQEGPDWTFHPVESEAEARAPANRAFGQEVISVQVLEFQRVDGDLWAKVKVHADSWCLAGGDPEVVAEGWVRVHADSGAPAVWFYSRGC